MSGKSARDALRLACQCDGKDDHHPLTDSEFDAIAREQGYINLDVDAETRKVLRQATEAGRIHRIGIPPQLSYLLQAIHDALEEAP
jgi:hypothetical protein